MKKLMLLTLLLTLLNGVAHADEPSSYGVDEIALPGATPDGIFMDYIAYDAKNQRVWVPAGNTGAVDVIDTATSKVTQVTGWKTQEMERRGKKRTVGPSSAAVGDGFVYIGNRGDFTVCAIEAKSLARGACSKPLSTMPDGIAYVAKTSEVWVTTPRDQSIRVLDARTLAEKARIAFEGEPEGFAVDAKRGRFYTNLEDKDRTVSVDIAARKPVATWMPACGEDGPKGLALDEKKGFLFVACPAGAEVLDVDHDGKVLSKIDAGDGVDNLDYSAERHSVYVGAAGAARLTVASVNEKGVLSITAQVATQKGARNGVVTDKGAVFLTLSSASKILVARPK